MSVEVIRAACLGGYRARIPRPPRRRFDRRACRSQRRLRQQRRALGDRREPAAGDRGDSPGAELVTVHQVHSAEVVYVDRAMAARRAAARRRDGHRPARPAARHPHRRLRAGAVRRCRGGRDRRGACRLARSAGRRHGSDDRRDGALGARRERIRAAIGPCIAQPSYEVDEGFRNAIPRGRPGNERFFAEPPGASRTSIWRLMSSTGFARAGIGDGRSAPPRHLCRRGPLLQLSPGHASGRSRLRAPAERNRAAPEVL